MGVDGSDRVSHIRTANQSRYTTLNAIRRRNYRSISAQNTRHSADQQVRAAYMPRTGEAWYIKSSVGNDLNEVVYSSRHKSINGSADVHDDRQL